ncbi:MAG: hemerythrin domain-containing protein [Bryobacteraceae bacterium]
MLTVADILRGPRPAGSAHDPLEHLTACHRRVEQRLETLARAIGVLPGQRAESLAAIDAALAFFATNGVRHTEDEEMSLFPRLLPKLTASERAVIELLEQEHGEAGLLHSELERLAVRLHDGGPDETAIEAFEACVGRLASLYGRHIAVEDTQVAGFARSRLTAVELTEISTEMKRRRGQ